MIYFNNSYPKHYSSIIRPVLPPNIEPLIINNKLVGIHYTYWYDIAPHYKVEEKLKNDEMNFLKNKSEKILIEMSIKEKVKDELYSAF